MMKWACKRRGAISIFLVIVLLPMMMVSTVFVDESRIQLARSMASSAGDLTLNSALTDYDTVLKEMYGLFATSQNIDDMYDKLEDYYRKSIIAAGIDDEDADDYVSQIMGYLKSQPGTDDLMNLNLTKFEIGQPDDGNLANAAQLKTQIVEFMKYRAPLSLGAGFLDALKCMKNLDKQTKLIDNKNEFYKEQQTLLEKLENAWKELQKYQYKDNSNENGGFPGINYFNSHNQSMSDEKGTLESAISTSIKYLNYNPAQLGWSNCEIEYSNGEWIFTSFGNPKTVKGEYESGDSVTTEDLINELNEAYTAKKIADNIFANNSNGSLNWFLDRLPSKNTTSNWNDIKWMYTVALFNASGSNENTYVRVTQNYLEAIINLQSALDVYGKDEADKIHCTKNEDKFIESSTGATLKKTCQDMIDHLIEEDADKITQGETFDIFNDKMDRLKAGQETIKDVYGNKQAEVSTQLNQVRNTAKNYYDLIDEKIGNISRARTLLGEVKNELDNADSEYNKKLASWNTSANGLKDTSLGQSDSSEIENVKKMISAEEIGKLLTKLSAVQTTLENIRNQIATYKYGSLSWKDFGDNPNQNIIFNNMREDQKSNMNSIAPTSDNGNDYDALINDVKSQIAIGDLKVTWSSTDQSDTVPDLSAGKRSFYIWLHNNYYDPNMVYDSSETTTSKTQTATDDANYKKTISDIENSGKKDDPPSSSKTNTSVDDYKAALPSGGNTNVAGGFSSYSKDKEADATLKENSDKTNSLLKNVLDMMGNAGTQLRDDMYVANYIMGMFTYDTYENEIYTANNSDKARAFDSWYTGEDGVYTIKDAYADMVPHAVSITKNEMSPNNNFLYGSEVEYIIYGNDASASKSKAYGTIFTLRFALNTVYAFTDAEINSISTSVATSLFGVPPLTPLIPIAKIAITLAFSLAESSYDLYTLKTGAAVPIMKNSKTWMMKPTNAAKAVAGEVVKEVGDKVIDEGYEKLNSLLNKTDEELNEIINGSEEEIEKLATTATSAVTDKFVGYAKEATSQLVTFINNVNMQYMGNEEKDENGVINADTLSCSPEKKTAVIAMLDEWLAKQQDGSPAIYEVKKIAVDYIKSNNIIDETFEAVKQTSIAKVDNISGALEAKINGINVEIQSKVSEWSEKAGSAVKEFKDKCVTDLKEAAKKGADSLREKLNESVGKAFGTGGSAEDGASSVVGSLLSWKYSDYLTLFLIVSMTFSEGSEKAMLTRTADLIQLNMEHMDEKKYATTADAEGAFMMKKASTYLAIRATIEVKPLLMALPFMENTTKSQLTGTRWYTIEYEGILGY